MKSKFLIAFMAICLLSLQAKAQKKIKVNQPLPLEYVSNLEKFYLNDTIEFVNPKMIIFAGISGNALLFHKAAKKQQRIKEEQIAKAVPQNEDTVILAKAVYDAFSKKLKQKGAKLEPKNENTQYILNVKVFDHGFHWATKSAAGIYIRCQVDVLSTSGELLWTQVYTLTKEDAAKTHKRKAIHINACVDKMLVDFKNDSTLLKSNYIMISQMLAERMFN